METSAPMACPELGPPRTTCPACQAPHAGHPTTTVTDRYAWTWDLARCRRCGVLYQVTPMTQEARVQFYGQGHYRALCGGRHSNPLQLQQDQGRYGQLWARYLPRLEGPVLDYGGSTGAVARALCGRRRLDLTVADYGDGATVTPEAALAVPDGTYRTVLVCQTLDHLPEPLETLRTLRAKARHVGHLFVDAVKAPHTPAKLDHDTYYPTLESLTSLVTRAGWHVLWARSDVDPRHYAVWADTYPPHQ